MRLLLEVAAQEGWPVHHMDVKSALLNGKLVEVYVVELPSITVIGVKHKVLHLSQDLTSP